MAVASRHSNKGKHIGHQWEKSIYCICNWSLLRRKANVHLPHRAGLGEGRGWKGPPMVIGGAGLGGVGRQHRQPEVYGVEGPKI